MSNLYAASRIKAIREYVFAVAELVDKAELDDEHVNYWLDKTMTDLRNLQHCLERAKEPEQPKRGRKVISYKE